MPGSLITISAALICFYFPFLTLYPKLVSNPKIENHFLFHLQFQTNGVIGKIMACSPHYVRCIKTSEQKTPLAWNQQRYTTYIYLIERFGIWYPWVFLRIVPYFDEPVGRVKIQQRIKILSDTTHQNVQ